MSRGGPRVTEIFVREKGVGGFIQASRISWGTHEFFIVPQCRDASAEGVCMQLGVDVLEGGDYFHTKYEIIPTGRETPGIDVPGEVPEDDTG